jgi:hypothetical protein
MKVASCESCEARLLWAITWGGKRMPLDAEPVGDEQSAPSQVFVLMKRGDDTPLALSLARLSDEAMIAAKKNGVSLYRSHFATCPNADEHRAA